MKILAMGRVMTVSLNLIESGLNRKYYGDKQRINDVPLLASNNGKFCRGTSFSWVSVSN